MEKANYYSLGLDKNPANYVPLTPLTFLERSASIWPNKTAVIYGNRRVTWGQVYERSRRLASALQKRGIGKGETVAVMLPNILEMYEMHFGIPASGAVINTMNIRLDAKILAFSFEHAEVKAIFVDKEFGPVVKQALAMAQNVKPLVIYVDDDQYDGPGERIGSITYNELLAEGDPEWKWTGPTDEWDAIALNYTSGTTGNPKGVVYHHRGAYINSLQNMITCGMDADSVYLWTLPMFHCNGWCFTWTTAAIACVNICLRKIDPKIIYKSVAEHRVTHACGAAVVLSMILNAKPEDRIPFPNKVKFSAAAAPVPYAIMKAAEENGFLITHLYGLTESYGPSTVSVWKDEFAALPIETQAKLRVRQGVRNIALEEQTVMNPETMERVPADGTTMGEVMLRGNIIMKGYLKNSKATQECFEGGWFHTGDLGVLHADGYIELKDRSKDIIISGGENISTIEVESILYTHPAVLEAAVVARPDEKWGETPCAFITLKEGASATEEEIIAFCRQNMAHFKAPRTIVFTSLPKTSTGKIQKYVLRERAKELNKA